MTDLYPITNSADIGAFLNNTLSSICSDVTNPLSCGAFIFFDIMILVAWLLLFSYFSVKNSFKDSYAGASTIIGFLTLILYLMNLNFIRNIELLFIIANMFLSIIALYMIKE